MAAAKVNVRFSARCGHWRYSVRSVTWLMMRMAQRSRARGSACPSQQRLKFGVPAFTVSVCKCSICPQTGAELSSSNAPRLGSESG